MVKLTTFHNTIPCITGERVYLARDVNRVCHLRAGMRIVIKWDADDTRNQDPRWGRIMSIEPTQHSTIAKLLIESDETYVDEYGIETDKLVHNVKTNQYGSYWCIYDVENQYGMESRDDEEFNMDWRVGEAVFDSDIYKALLLHSFK